MLPVSLDCLRPVSGVANVSGLSILDCAFSSETLATLDTQDTGGTQANTTWKNKKMCNTDRTKNPGLNLFRSNLYRFGGVMITILFMGTEIVWSQAYIVKKIIT
jgi:hypothetical protein